MKNHEPQSLERQKLAKELKSLRKERFLVKGLKNKVIRIEYVRMIGVSGDGKLALSLKDEVDNFMKNTLVQKLHPVKTKITDIRNGNAHFLGSEKSIYLRI